MSRSKGAASALEVLKHMHTFEKWVVWKLHNQLGADEKRELHVHKGVLENMTMQHMQDLPTLAVCDFKPQYLASTFRIDEIPQGNRESRAKWVLLYNEIVSKPPKLGLCRDSQLPRRG